MEVKTFRKCSDQANRYKEIAKYLIELFGSVGYDHELTYKGDESEVYELTKGEVIYRIIYDYCHFDIDRTFKGFTDTIFEFEETSKDVTIKIESEIKKGKLTFGIKLVHTA